MAAPYTSSTTFPNILNRWDEMAGLRTGCCTLPSYRRARSTRDKGDRLNQVAAPAEKRAPNLHRAKSHHSSRVRMEGWRQRLTRPEKNLVHRKNKRTHLTPTGLLMEAITLSDHLKSGHT